jgi:hypothetical protein
MKLIGKKGDIFQLFYFLIIIFIVAMLGLLFLKLTHGFTDAIKNDATFNTTPNVMKANTVLSTQARTVADEFVLLMFIGMMITIIVAAAKTNFTPTIIFLFILLLLFAILVSAGLVDIYNGFASTDVLSSEASSLTFTKVLISQYLPVIITVLGGIVLIIMYGKSGGNIQV